MGFFSSLSNSLMGAATIPCVCPVKMLDQLKKLIPHIPPLPEIPIPKLDPLTPITTAAPTPANSFIRARLDLINKMRIPPIILRIPLDHMKIGQMESVPPFLRTMQGALGVKIDDPKLTAKLQGSLLGLLKLPAIPPIPLPAMPPPPPAIMQKLSTVVTQMRMARANLDIKLLPLDPSALLKIQLAARAVATIPPFPFEQMAPLAPLATLVRLTSSMGIDIKMPRAMMHLANKLNLIAKLPAAIPPTIPALPAMMSILSIAQVYDNLALFFKLDLARLTPPAFIAKIGVPLQPLVALTENMTVPLTPSQAANAQSWAAASQFFPALQLMQNFDVGRLDLAPLADLPPLPNVGPITSMLALGEAASRAPGAKNNKKCPQCPLG